MSSTHFSFMRPFLLALILFCTTSAQAQSEVEMQIQLLTSDLIAEVNLDQKPFIEWVGAINDIIESELVKEPGDHEVVVLITLHQKQPATISVNARPAISEVRMKGLLAGLQQPLTPNTRITDYSFSISSKVNSGCPDESMAFTPPLVYPWEAEFNAFNQMNLAAKKAALEDWVKQEVIPITAQFTNSVDAKFEGVLYVGSVLSEKKFEKETTEKLTDQNPNYWRANMEMSQGNQMILFAKIAMFLANGEFDKAERLLFLLPFFSNENSLPIVYLEPLQGKMDLITAELNAAIEKGIALHDVGKYEEAVTYYESLLKVFPKSAWLNYEHYFSSAAMLKESSDSEALWIKSKGVIYECDPLYPLDIKAKTGKEGYLLFRRQEIKMLFQSKESLKADFLNYADIALELENYGYAAQMYWLIVSYFPEEDHDNRDMLAHYLYCLDKLGDKTTIQNFKGDFEARFAQVEAERLEAMKNSTMYNVFEKQE